MPYTALLRLSIIAAAYSMLVPPMAKIDASMVAAKSHGWCTTGVTSKKA
ncbi:hypothetical protein Lesp02_33100 [Lentzea sp. NBRC 105346]|nr:hypothetical protein Lesp02_33100 [Lentzea sp. NBRC 105346]